MLGEPCRGEVDERAHVDAANEACTQRDDPFFVGRRMGATDIDEVVGVGVELFVRHPLTPSVANDR